MTRARVWKLLSYILTPPPPSKAWTGGMPSASEAKRSRHLNFRFLCIRCGEVLSSQDLDSLADQMRRHFTDTWRPQDSGCERLPMRHPHTCIAFFDHGMHDALWHTQRQLDRVNREVADQRNVAATLERQADDLRAQLKTVHTECKQLRDLAAKPKSAVAETLAAVAESSAARARKLRAALHPDGLSGELRVGAKRAWDEARL